MGVHGADINSAPPPHAEEKSQHSNDPRRALRRRARSCQRCGHWIGWRDRLRGALAAVRGALNPGPAPPSAALPFPTPAPGAGGADATPSPACTRPGRSTPRGWGSTGRGLCVLHEGPTYPECPRPSSSGSRPSCSTGRAPSQRLRAAEPPRQRGASSQEGPVHPRRCLEAPRHPAHWRGLRSGRPTGGLRCHDLRSSQVMRQLAGLSGTATRSGPSPKRGPRPRCPGPARHRGS